MVVLFPSSRPAVRTMVLLLTVTAALAACTGGDRVQVPTRTGGVLDCPDELVASATHDLLAEAIGAPDPEAALAALPESVRPPQGVATLEESTATHAVLVLRDGDGNRIGRVGVTLLDSGWFVMWSEECGTKG